MSKASGPHRSWRESFLGYTKPQVIALFFLGFSAGLPYLLVFSTLSIWLTEANVSRSTIGFFAWVGITFSVKIFWAPIIDQLRIPWLTAKLGQRRSWMIAAQLFIALAIIMMALTNPAEQLTLFAILAVLVAFGAATQDISIDAFRIEAADAEYQGEMAATYIFGYRVALLVSGAGALYIAEFGGWTISYLAMAGLMAVGIITSLLVTEPNPTRPRIVVSGKTHSQRLASWLAEAVVAPFADFFKRQAPYALLILLLIGLYKVSDITMGIMANPFYLDLGFSKIDIANIGKIYGFAMSMAGTLAGGLLVARYGIMGPLFLGAILVATTNLLFAAMALGGPDISMLTLVISADNISGGLATAAFIAYLSSLTNRSYTATQYAAFSSIMTLPAKFLSGFSGIIVTDMGYASFFIYTALLGIPAILLVALLIYLQSNQHSGDKTT